MTDTKPMPDKIEVEVDEARAETMVRAIFRAATPPNPSLKKETPQDASEK